MTRNGPLVVEEVCGIILPFLSMAEHSKFRSCNRHISCESDSDHAWWVYCMIHFYKINRISEHACNPAKDVDWRGVARMSQRLGYVDMELVHRPRSPTTGTELALGIQLLLSSMSTTHAVGGAFGDCWCAAMRYVYYGYNVATKDRRSHHLKDGWYIGPYDYFDECAQYTILSSQIQHQPRIEFERFTSRVCLGNDNVVSDTSVRMIVYLHPKSPWMETIGLSVRLFLHAIFVDGRGVASAEPIINTDMSHVDISLGSNVAGVGTVFEDVFSPSFYHKILAINVCNRSTCMPVIMDNVVLCMQAVLINQGAV